MATPPSPSFHDVDPHNAGSHNTGSHNTEPAAAHNASSHNASSHNASSHNASSRDVGSDGASPHDPGLSLPLPSEVSETSVGSETSTVSGTSAGVNGPDAADFEAFAQFPALPPPNPWPQRITSLLLVGLSVGGWRMWQGHWDPRCDRAYAICVPSPPPSLSCEQVPAQDFRVYLPHHRDKPWGLHRYDPHGFDPDGDGYGCEAGGPIATSP
ncbi:MAG: hypothetical protein ACO4AJ_06550 [Prochlorothrix sp.]